MLIPPLLYLTLRAAGNEGSGEKGFVNDLVREYYCVSCDSAPLIADSRSLAGSEFHKKFLNRYIR